jgi:hypothetical protein
LERNGKKNYEENFLIDIDGVLGARNPRWFLALISLLRA